MSSNSSFTVTVPATTANLGPGFDCIGAALSLYNEFKFTRLANDTPVEEDRALRISVKGVEAKRVKTDDSNLVYQAFSKFYQHLGHPPARVQIDINLGVPLARGLGSSATAIVGGLVGANCLAGSPLTPLDVMQMAIAMEGHPDNVVPALLGGCRLAAYCEQTLANSGLATWEVCEVSWHNNILPVVAIPDFELSTSDARRVLPDSYNRSDSIFNIAHLGLLMRGLQTGNANWLRIGMQDKIHQPYRQTLIPGFDAVSAAALEAGACGVAISGAGPTLLALTPASLSTEVEKAMASAWSGAGVTSQVRTLQLDTRGAKVSLNP